MATSTVETAPLRVRDVVRASHVAVSLASALFAIGCVLLPLAVWKGTVDTQLQSQKDQNTQLLMRLDRLEDKLDTLQRLIAGEKEKR